MLQTLYGHNKELFYPYGISVFQLMHEQFEDTTEVTRSRASKDSQYKRKRRKGQTVIYKTLHRKLKIEQHGPTKQNQGWIRVLSSLPPTLVGCWVPYLLHWWGAEFPTSYTGGTHRITLVRNSVRCHKCGKDAIVVKTNGTYTWSLVRQILHNG